MGQRKVGKGRDFDGLDPSDHFLFVRSCPTCPPKKYNMGGPEGVEPSGHPHNLTVLSAGSWPGQAKPAKSF